MSSWKGNQEGRYHKPTKESVQMFQSRRKHPAVEKDRMLFAHVYLAGEELLGRHTVLSKQTSSL